MSAQDESLDNLKTQLNSIQNEISRVEQKTDNSKDVRELLVWLSPARVFRKRDAKWVTNIAILVLALIVILLFIREFIAISVVLAIAFVSYVLATVPPEDIEHRITTQGVTTAGHTYLWNELVDFWFNEKFGQRILNIETKLRYPGRLIILQGHVNSDKLRDVLVTHIPFREVPKSSWLDKLYDLLYKRLPASMR